MQSVLAAAALQTATIRAKVMRRIACIIGRSLMAALATEHKRLPVRGRRSEPEVA